MTMQSYNVIPDLHPQYLTNQTGERILVALPTAEWDNILELLEDLEDIAYMQQAKAEIAQGEQCVAWDDIKAEYGL